MEEKAKIEKVFHDIKDYAETRLDIMVLDAQDKASGVISTMASSVILGVIGFLILLFVSVGGAWLLGEYFDSPSIGFFSIAAFYLLVGVLVYVNRDKWIRMPIINSIIRKITFHENN